MPQLHSPQFGEVTFEDGQVIEFPGGLPAFEDLRRFLLLQVDGSTMGALQSVDQPSVCFPVLPIAAVTPDYQMDVPPEDCERLLATEAEIRDVLPLAIVTLTESGPATANLLAPVLINARARRGVQLVRADALYSLEYALAPGAEEQVACS